MSQPAARTTDFILHSPQTGTDYSIFVAAPAPARETGPWPAIAFMDGDDQFKYAVAAYRAARDTGEVPPLLLVGVGYGASFKGLAPLLTMMNCCSPGVAVVNIDNGFGAAYFASLINS